MKRTRKGLSLPPASIPCVLVTKHWSNTSPPNLSLFHPYYKFFFTFFHSTCLACPFCVPSSGSFCVSGISLVNWSQCLQKEASQLDSCSRVFLWLGSVINFLLSLNLIDELNIYLCDLIIYTHIKQQLLAHKKD